MARSAPPSTATTSDRILDAAVGEFERFGLRRTSVDDIARAAGVSRMTVYRWFPDREAVVQAAMMREVASALAELERTLAGVDDPEDRAVSGFAHILRAARSHPVLTRLLELEPETVVAALTDAGGPAMAALRAFVAAELQRTGLGEPRTDAERRRTAEAVARLGLSLVMAPGGAIALGSHEQAQAFARSYVLPLMRV